MWGEKLDVDVVKEIAVTIDEDVDEVEDEGLLRSGHLVEADAAYIHFVAVLFISYCC